MSEIKRLREALEWALPLASIALESHRLERVRCGHDDIQFTYKDGTPGVGLWQEEYDAREKARAALSTPPAARGEWQDMDSAPHDGRDIETNAGIVHWSEAKGCFYHPDGGRHTLHRWRPAPPSPRTPEGQ